MRCRLRMAAGRPRIEIDGASHPPLLYSTSILAPGQLAMFHELGVDFVSFPATCDFQLYRLAEQVWHGPDNHHWCELDDRLRTIVEANPDAWILPRVYTCSPPWWDDMYPDDLVVWDDGTTAKHLYHGACKTQVPSLGSARWRAAMVDNLTRLIRHVEESPWADRVIGYMVNSENSEEWFHWGLMEGYLYDYNPQTEARFRDWLRARYGTDDALAAAWGRAARIDDVVTPTREARRTFDARGIRHPVEGRDAIDYSLFLGDLFADVIGELAAAVKSATGGDKLFGTFYGYMLELAYHRHGIQDGGHLGLERVLENSEVDFLASPTSYARRLPGDGYSLSMVPNASLTARGRVFFHENDVRTHVLHDDAGYGRTDDAWATCAIQRREFAQALTRGHGMWWYDMTTGWYDDAPLRDTIASIVEIAGRAHEHGHESVAEVALVVDEDGLLHAGNPPDQVSQLVVHQCLELSRLGAPFDVVRLADLGRTPAYRLLLFPTTFRADAAKRDRLHALLRERGATALWIGPAGIADGEITLENVAALTGIRLAEPPHPHFNIVSDGETTWGSTTWHGPGPILDDDGAAAAGDYGDIAAVGFASREMDGWRSVWSGAPAVAGSVLRRLARDAGVHLYLDDEDAVYACRRFLGLHGRTAGLKTLSVPDTDVLYDLFNDVEVPAKDGVFRVWLPRAETQLYFRGSKSTW